MLKEKSAALTRSIRLKRPEEALYWLARLRDEGASTDRLTKQLLQSTLRDNLSVDLTGHLLDGASKNVPASGLVILLATSQKLWSVHEGRQLTRIAYELQSDCSLRPNSDDELLFKFDNAIGEASRLMECLQIAHEIWTRRQFGLAPYRRLLDQMGPQLDHDAKPAFDVLYDLTKARADAGVPEETWLYLILTWTVTGLWGQEIDPEPEAIHARVATRQAMPEPIPDWSKPEDRRFEGTWDGYANMALMFEECGRLDPDDDGVLFKTEGGQWKPLIREESGLYLVQSEAEPRQFYEVNLAILSCTCLYFLRRQRPCKHVAAAREHLETQLPFVIG